MCSFYDFINLTVCVNNFEIKLLLHTEDKLLSSSRILLEK